MDNLNLKKQMPRNFGMSVLSFIVNIIIGLWLIPYLVKYMGIAAYGLVPLAMIFSEYVGLIVQSLNSSINRFLLIALQKKDFFKANQVFNTSLSMMLLLVLVQSFIMVFILFDLGEVVDIPAGLAEDAFWLFTFTFLGFSISLLNAVFSTPIFAYNRLDILQAINIAQIASRVFIIVLLFTVSDPQLKYVGLANLVEAIVGFGLTLLYTRRFAPELTIDLSMIDTKQMKELASMSGWVFVNQIGFLLFLKMDLYIANKFIGATQAGQYAAFMQWSSLLRTMAGIFSGIISPVVMIYYARDEMDKLISMLKISVKLMGIIMAVPIGIFSALSEEIMGVWLGEAYRDLGLLLLLSLVPLVINLSILPLFSVNVSFNKVKIPGIVSVLFGMLNIGLALIFVMYTKWELYGLVIAVGIALTLKNAVFTPLYAAHILGIQKNTFFHYQIAGVLFFLFVFLLTKMLAIAIVPHSTLLLLVVASIACILSIFVLVVYLARDKEMTPFVNAIKEKIKLKKTNKVE